MAYGRMEQPLTEKGRAVAAYTGAFSAQQIADLLAVLMWAHRVLVDEIAAAQQFARPDPAIVLRLDSLLISVRRVANARGELAKLDVDLLLDGFAVWAARQRAVMDLLASSSLGRE